MQDAALYSPNRAVNFVCEGARPLDLRLAWSGAVSSASKLDPLVKPGRAQTIKGIDPISSPGLGAVPVEEAIRWPVDGDQGVADHPTPERLEASAEHENLLVAEATAREIGHVSLVEALELIGMEGD